MRISEYIEQLNIYTSELSNDSEVTRICINSKLVIPGAVFIAVKGSQVDGHAYIQQAIEAGAHTIVCEHVPSIVKLGINYLEVQNAAHTAGLMASMFFGNPSSKLQLIGVTGTNGKTSTATLLYNLFKKLGYTVGLISTVKNCIQDEVIPSTHTTPDCIALNELLGKMVAGGCTYCFMEVSSHAIHQYRIAGLVFKGGIFSNITHDHLDYHGTFKNYLDAKKKFFDDLPKASFALTNMDDKNGMVMVQNCSAKIKTYSLSSLSDFRAQIFENAFSGLVLKIDGEEVHTRLVGEFNAYNMLAVYATAILLEQDKTQVLIALSSLEAVEGRFNYIVSDKDKIVGIVDYAHTPDALEKVLETINGSRTKDVKVITIVGCGGDRDKTKRPVMGDVASKMSQKIILTSDNPRSESAVEIIKEMKSGIDAGRIKNVLSIVDRREAIRTACTIAERGDIILLAGKGHETYQEINGVKHPFDDKQVLAETFIELDR